MRTSTIVMMVSALLFGVLAVFVAQAWLNQQAELRMKGIETPQAGVSTRNVVVASTPLRFGTQVSAGALREVAWPEGAIPAGTFSSVDEVLKGKRIVLSSIEPNEPILAAKITGPGQKATLSALIQDGMKAVTVRVNDVEGVAGFVLPGDHVDVLMTRQIDKAGTTDVVLQDVRVLAVDQLADDSSDKPTVVKAVTLEVATVDAQKVSLASSIGALSLILRKAGESAVEGTRRIGVTDLGTSEPGRPQEAKRFSTIVVTRASKPEQKTQEYNVPVESGNWLEANKSGRGRAQQ